MLVRAAEVSRWRVRFLVGAPRLFGADGATVRPSWPTGGDEGVARQFGPNLRSSSITSGMNPAWILTLVSRTIRSPLLLQNPISTIASGR